MLSGQIRNVFFLIRIFIESYWQLKSDPRKLINISLPFGNLQVLREVTMSVQKNEKVAIMVTNVAGKTSFRNCITGFIITRTFNSLSGRLMGRRKVCY